MTVYRVIEYPTYWAVKCPVNGRINVPRDGRWTFDGNYERPTFSPSINETWGKPGQTMEEFNADPNPNRNHVFIRDGHIEFLSDCTHSFAGSTVEIEPLSLAEMRMYWPDV